MLARIIVNCLLITGLVKASPITQEIPVPSKDQAVYDFINGWKNIETLLDPSRLKREMNFGKSDQNLTNKFLGIVVTGNSIAGNPALKHALNETADLGQLIREELDYSTLLTDVDKYAINAWSDVALDVLRPILVFMPEVEKFLSEVYRKTANNSSYAAEQFDLGIISSFLQLLSAKEDNNIISKTLNQNYTLTGNRDVRSPVREFAMSSMANAPTDDGIVAGDPAPVYSYSAALRNSIKLLQDARALKAAIVRNEPDICYCSTCSKAQSRGDKPKKDLTFGDVIKSRMNNFSQEIVDLLSVNPVKNTKKRISRWFDSFLSNSSSKYDQPGSYRSNFGNGNMIFDFSLLDELNNEMDEANAAMAAPLANNAVELESYTKDKEHRNLAAYPEYQYLITPPGNFDDQGDIDTLLKNRVEKSFIGLQKALKSDSTQQLIEDVTQVASEIPLIGPALMTVHNIARDGVNSAHELVAQMRAAHNSF